MKDFAFKWNGIDLLCSHFDLLLLEYAQFYQFTFARFHCWGHRWSEDLQRFAEGGVPLSMAGHAQRKIIVLSEDAEDWKVLEHLNSVLREELSEGW